jgi:hypothetical protein
MYPKVEDSPVKKRVLAPFSTDKGILYLEKGKTYFATQFRYPATHFRKSPSPFPEK